MTQQTTTQHNDVDLAALGALVEGIQDDPAKAETTWAAHVTWDGGFASHARIRQFDAIASDEPPALGGGDSAPDPVEQLHAKVLDSSPVGHTLRTAVPVDITLA